MKGAVKDAEGEVMSVFDLNTLGEAVEIKHALERQYNEMHNVDEIFTVAKATRQEIRDFWI